MKKVFSAIREKLCEKAAKLHCRMTDRKGDLAVNTIGGIIIAVVLIGLLIVAIRAFFPNFFSTMFASMRTKLNGYW